MLIYSSVVKKILNPLKKKKKQKHLSLGSHKSNQLNRLSEMMSVKYGNLPEQHSFIKKNGVGGQSSPQTNKYAITDCSQQEDAEIQKTDVALCAIHFIASTGHLEKLQGRLVKC